MAKSITRDKIIDFCARHACGFKSRRSSAYKEYFAIFSSWSDEKLFKYYKEEV